jgi:hypothetical protein
MSSVAERIAADVSKCIRDFGESFRCTHSGSISTILGIFDANFSLENSVGGNYSAKAIAGTFATADVEDYERGDTFERVKTGVTYYLLHPEGDGMEEGLTVLIFSKDPPHG